jgi:hypothetical protein
MADKTTIGVEIDGTRLTVVEVAKGRAVSVRTVTGATTAEAIELLFAKFRQKRTDAPVRMSLATPGVRMRRIDVSSLLKQRRLFEDAVFSSMNTTRTGSTTAGLFFNPENLIGDTVSGGVGVIGPESPVLAAYAAAGKVRTEIVPPPLSMIGANGLWLGFRYETADLTLVVDNQPVAYRQLPVGGLNAIIRRLGEGGEDRMRAVISGGGMADPVAASELDAHLRQLVEEVVATIDFFRREGEHVPQSLCVYGPGANTGISSILAQRGFQVEMPEWLSKRLAVLPLADRDEAVGAFFAGATSGLGLPQVSFVNPDAARLAGELARRDQRAKYVLIGVIVAGVFALVGVGPLARAWLDARTAQSDLDSAKARLEQYREEDRLLRTLNARESTITEIDAQRVGWSEALAAVYDSKPSAAQITNLTATGSGDTVNLSISIESSGGYSELAGWLNDLTARYGNGSAWTSSFSTRDGITVYEMRLTVTTGTTEDAGGTRDGEDGAAVPAETTVPTETTVPGAGTTTIQGDGR